MVAALQVAFSENAMDVPSKDLNNLLDKCNRCYAFLSRNFQKIVIAIKFKNDGTKEISKTRKICIWVIAGLLTALYLYSASGKYYFIPNKWNNLHLADWRNYYW